MLWHKNEKMSTASISFNVLITNHNIIEESIGYNWSGKDLVILGVLLSHVDLRSHSKHMTPSKSGQHSEKILIS